MILLDFWISQKKIYNFLLELPKKGFYILLFIF